MIAYYFDRKTNEIKLLDLKYPQGMNDYGIFRKLNEGEKFVEERIKNHKALNEYYKDKGYISNNQIVTFDKNYK